MPCFLVGEGTARAIASVREIPVYRTSHQIGHILAAAYSAQHLELIRKPCLSDPAVLERIRSGPARNRDSAPGKYGNILAAGADVNVTNGDGWTARMRAWGLPMSYIRP